MTDPQVKQIRHRIISTKAGNWTSLAATRVWLKVKDIMTTRVLTIDPLASLADAARAMASHKVSCIVVVKEGQIVGILTNRDFLKKIALGPELNAESLYSRTVASCMSSPVECIDPDQPIIEAARLIHQRGIRRLPVLDAGQLVGIVTETDLTRALTSCNPINSVAQIMATDVAVVPPDATIARAAAIMAERRISSVVVVRSDEPIGVVTERDVLTKVTAKQLDPDQVTVEQVMTSSLVTIDPSYSVFCAARIMEQMHIHRLVVTEGRRLVGIVSQTDVFRATQRSLLAQQEGALELFDSSRSPIFILDGLLNTIYLNPAFCDLFHLDRPEELLDRPFLPEQFWQDPTERQQFLDQIRQGQMHIELLRLKTLKSEPIYVSVACTLLRDIHGHISGYQGAMHDVTAKVLAEQASALAYQRLEKANQQLRQIQSQIVQTERLASIGQLAAGVAHEMNTPVGFVASNFEALQKYVGCLRQLVMHYEQLVQMLDPARYPELAEKLSELDGLKAKMKIGFILEDIQSLFEESKEGLERVTAIIKNLRDLSRTDQTDKWDDYDINAGIEATVVVARNELKYDAELIKELADVPTVPAHTNQINQVLLNIIVNAAQAIRSQGRKTKGRITIRTYATDEHVVCQISDDGPGIQPEHMAKIFQPFFTTKPAGKGTGLGLSLSHDIVVNKHKGQLLVDSSPGAGATFTIMLPRVQKAAYRCDALKEVQCNG